MFSHDSEAFQLMCCCLYYRTHINNEKEEAEVIEAIKARKVFLNTFSKGSDIYKKLCDAYGFSEGSYVKDGGDK